MDPTCYCPLTICSDCGETYCEKCEPHICALIETSEADFVVLGGSIIQTPAEKRREAIRDTQGGVDL